MIQLTDIREEDREDLIKILVDPRVGKNYMLPEDPDREVLNTIADRFIALSTADSRYVRSIRQNGTLVGFINDTGISDGWVELGWVVSPQWQNRGIGSAAVGIAIRELFALGYDAVFAGHFERNIPSLRVMQKNGMLPMEKQDMITYRGETLRCLYRVIRREDLA